MTNTNTIWVLGASDPEMEMIVALLRECNQDIVYARDMEGQRVRRVDAYAAVNLGMDLPPASPGVEVILIECDAPDLGEGFNLTHIDHHRPGDPGFGKSPADFMPGSSIGQVIARLATMMVLPTHAFGLQRWISWFEQLPCNADEGTIMWNRCGWCVVFRGRETDLHWGPKLWVADIPEEFVLCAAADHCLAHAYAGECPGVDPNMLMSWRAVSRAKFQQRPVQAVLADIETAITLLQAALRMEIAGVSVASFANQHIPELPEAAARLGIPFISFGLRDKAGKRKVVLQSAPPQVIEAWLNEQHALGRKTYGDLTRGFAEAIL